MRLTHETLFRGNIRYTFMFRERKWRRVKLICLKIFSFFIIIAMFLKYQTVSQKFAYDEAKQSLSPFQSLFPRYFFENSPRIHHRDGVINLSPEPFYALWPNDPECSHFVTRFAENLPRVTLLSYPGSGATWFRYLLEGATGIFTGSFLNDTFHYEELGFLGEKDHVNSGRTIVQKTHRTPDIRSNRHLRTILLLRCPQQSILSYWHWKENEDFKKPYLQKVNEADLHRINFRFFVRDRLPSWRQLHSFALRNVTNLISIFYDDLINDTQFTLRQILDFIGVYPDEERMKCVGKHREGPVKRVHSSKAFSIEGPEKKLLQNSVRYVNSLLKDNTFSPLENCV